MGNCRRTSCSIDWIVDSSFGTSGFGSGLFCSLATETDGISIGGSAAKTAPVMSPVARAAPANDRIHRFGQKCFRVAFAMSQRSPAMVNMAPHGHVERTRIQPVPGRHPRYFRHDRFSELTGTSQVSERPHVPGLLRSRASGSLESKV